MAEVAETCTAVARGRGCWGSKDMGAASSRLAVLAFTDVVGSTDLKARLGDAAAGKLLERHNELVRRALAEAGGGAILKDTGDGFLLQFGTPSDAVRFALLLQYT